MERRDQSKTVHTYIGVLMDQYMKTSETLREIHQFITEKYYEVEDFSLCILLSMISGTNMIALGQPGIAKSAVLREVVKLIEFDGHEGTPYFHIQMGSDVSPNHVFGAPDIDYFKKHGIIKRHFEGFLPDAIIAFCSEFYRVNDQVANSGLLTILNEGEFKNGVDTIQTKLRFFMADTNFFPKQMDDLDVEETDLKLQALHDRFLSRVLVKPVSDQANKVKMVLMDDTYTTDIRLSLDDLIAVQDHLKEIQLGEDIASLMVLISTTLEQNHSIFISPRRLKLSRNLVKAHAYFSGRSYCVAEDLIALQFSFWQKEEDIIKALDCIYDVMNKPQHDAHAFDEVLQSILDELDRNIDNQRDFDDFDIAALYEQAIEDCTKLTERILMAYPDPERYVDVNASYKEVSLTYKRLMTEHDAVG